MTVFFWQYFKYVNLLSSDSIVSDEQSAFNLEYPLYVISHFSLSLSKFSFFVWLLILGLWYVWFLSWLYLVFVELLWGLDEDFHQIWEVFGHYSNILPLLSLCGSSLFHFLDWIISINLSLSSPIISSACSYLFMSHLTEISFEVFFF